MTKALKYAHSHLGNHQLVAQVSYCVLYKSAVPSKLFVCLWLATWDCCFQVITSYANVQWRMLTNASCHA